MLRGSVQATGQSVDLAGIGDAMVDPILNGAVELRALVDAVVLRDHLERDGALQAVVDVVGVEGAVRAAAVIGNFEMMNRHLDAMGIGPNARSTSIASDLRVPWPPEAH